MQAGDRMLVRARVAMLVGASLDIFSNLKENKRLAEIAAFVLQAGGLDRTWIEVLGA